MPYVIRYFGAGQTQLSARSADSFVSAKKIAAEGLGRYGIDHAEITDQSGKIIWWRVDQGEASTARAPVTPLHAALRAVGGIARRH